MTITTIYNNIADAYDDMYQKDKYVLDELRTRECLIKLKPYGSVLSMGCGTGQDIFIGDFKPENFLGLDISSKMLEIAKSKYPEYTFIEWDCNNYYDYYCDTVVGMYGVINYTSLDSFFTQVSRSNATKFFAVLFSPKYTPELGAEYVIHYTKEDIAKIANSFGYEYSLEGLFKSVAFDQNDYWILRSK